MDDRLDLELLDPSHLRAAREVAERLAAAGHRGWIVGGAVRDLALGRRPKDVDMVSGALPDQVEALFERTLGVGKAFGIILVQLAELEVELATFREDGSYADGRRPDQVVYGDSLELDAQRRDFTCNALYLDPRTGEVNDPTGGLPDLRAGRLRTVGEPARRFAEDGLRLLRMVRFQASHDLEPAPGLHAAARQCAGNLEGTSVERVLEELRRTFAWPNPARAYRTLADCGLLAEVAPWASGDVDLRAARLEHLPADLSDPVDPAAAALLVILESGDPSEMEQHLRSLKPSKALLTHWQQLLTLRSTCASLAGGDPDPAARARALREPAAPVALALALAGARAAGDADLATGLQSLQAWFAEHGDELRPAPLLSASDLIAAGIAPGPEIGRLLRALEDAQLRGEISDESGARAWLEREV